MGGEADRGQHCLTTARQPAQELGAFVVADMGSENISKQGVTWSDLL